MLQPRGFAGWCYVFTFAQLHYVEAAVSAMQADNQPHNLLITPRHIYVWPKPLSRPPRSFELYPETVGGPELLGSWTVYTPDVFERLSRADCDELARINTAPLPSRLLAAASDAMAVDDAAVLATATSDRAVSRKPIDGSRTVEALPNFALHRQSWPQDRPIAKALANNIGLC